MRLGFAAVLLLCFSAVVFTATPPNPIPPDHFLYPLYIEGFDVCFLDDMSDVIEIHVQTYPPNNNFTMIIYGGGRTRTVYPHDHGYVVGGAPHEGWHLPFTELHTLQNGTDVWGFGPIDPWSPLVPPNFQPMFGYDNFIAVVSTKGMQYTSINHIGVSTLTSMVPVRFPNADILGYFAGFFPDHNISGLLHFGVVRAFFNSSADTGDNFQNTSLHWYHDWDRDFARIVNASLFVSYNTFFKPMVHHLFEAIGGAKNVTYTIVIDPFTTTITNVLGSWNHSVPLTIDTHTWIPPRDMFGGIVSSAVHPLRSLIILGIGVPGSGTGEIIFVDVATLTTTARIPLPHNYSNPKALVVDMFNDTLYVGMNGGGSIVRIDFGLQNYTGHQTVPFFADRIWAGDATFEHVWFVTNEQHPKLLRLNKLDFCHDRCPELGWCFRGTCTCGDDFELQNGECHYKKLIQENSELQKAKAGEAALAVFFVIFFLLAVGGWFLVWKNKRQGYTPV